MGEAAVDSTADASTWNTIASPHFTVYQRNRRCWAGGEDAESRILTGKNKVFDPEPDYGELEMFGLEPQRVERHFAGQGSDPPPAFAGFSGGSFYQVDAIDKKSIYSSPDQPVKPVYEPVKPVYEPVKPVFVDPSAPVIIEEKQFFDPTFSRGKAAALLEIQTH